MRQESPRSVQCLALECPSCHAEAGLQCFDRRRGYSAIYPHTERFTALSALKE